MKKITQNTILKQGDIIYQSVEIDGVVCWSDGSKIIAQSEHIRYGVPVVDLHSYVGRLGLLSANSKQFANKRDTGIARIFFYKGYVAN